MVANRFYTPFWRLSLVACFTLTGLLASESHGVVKSGGLPVPGATVTATQGDKKVVTTTDDTGYYSFPDLADGVWKITVESLGFVTANRDIGVASDVPGPEWDLKYQTLEAISNPTKAEAPAATPSPATAPAANAAGTPAAQTKPNPPATPAAATPSAAANPPARNARNGRNSTGSTAPAGNGGRPSLNAALAGQGQGQGQAGGFTRLNVGQTGDALATPDVGAQQQQQDMGDIAAQGNDSYTINGSVSSGLGMPQPGGDWMAGARMGGFGQDMGGGMGPGGQIPGMGGASGEPNPQAAVAGVPGGPGGGPGGGGFGGRGGGGFGGGGRGGPGGMMGGIPNFGGRGGRGRGPGGRNPGAFGNNRRDPRSRYNFAASLNNFTNSFLNAQTYSVTGQEVAKPAAQTLRATFTAGGPLKIPHVFDTHGKGTFTVNYSLTRNRNGYTWQSLVPTDAERAGNFNGILVPGPGNTQVPLNLSSAYPNNQIPASMISPATTALLKFYPHPNFSGGTAASPLNFSTSATGYTNGDNINARLSYSFNTKNQVNGGIQWQRMDTVTPSEFAAVTPGWQDTSTANGVNANVAYIYHFTTRVIATTRYNYSRGTTLVTPFFANNNALGNLEGTLGILGTDQSPLYWGPPSLGFSSGFLSLSATNPSYLHPQTSALGETLLWVRGTHEFIFGGDYSRREVNTLSQLNPRGSFSFNGGTTGYDFADFLLGSPATMRINVANSLSGAQAAQLGTATGSQLTDLETLQNTPSGGDRYLRTSVYDLYLNDQWRITPRISLSLGVRWDYQAPTTELYNRLATIDLPANFQVPLSVSQNLPATGYSVVAGQVGPVTGFHYSDSMLNGQKTDISPRIGFAFKPFAKHSTVIRGGYGLYYIPSIYSSLVGQLDAQTPFSTAYNLSNTCGATIQNGLSLAAIKQLGCVAQNAATTTNAMNPYFRVGYTQNWQMSVQENLMWNTIATVTYVGIKGTGLPQSFYPNSFPTSIQDKNTAVAPCTAGFDCPNGYIYETSNGNSTDQQVNFSLMRRLRSGLGGMINYSLNKAIDDTPTNTQNWLDLAAERARSQGIRSQTLNFGLQYSTGVGAQGGGLVNGWKGVLFKDWTLMPGLVLASGAPINITDSQVILGGTASQSSIRANYMGGPVMVDGHLNQAAFAAPAAGTYGNLGRNAVNGPGQFTTTLAANRTFRLADRRNLTFSVVMVNPLNHPVVSAWYSTIGANNQFGVPSTYFNMRSLNASLRFNF